MLLIFFFFKSTLSEMHKNILIETIKKEMVEVLFDNSGISSYVLDDLDIVVLVTPKMKGTSTQHLFNYMQEVSCNLFLNKKL